MFRFAFAALAIIGLGSLLFGSIGHSVGGGFLLLAPLLFVLKIMFFLMIFGIVRRGFGYGRGRAWDEAPWTRRRTRSRRQEEGPSQEKQFDEWHRMSHARDEVDQWVEGEI